MLEYSRLSEILNILSEKKSSSVRALAQKLYVSDATVRRDLNVLEKQGHVRRVFGGVILLENDQKELPFYGHTSEDASKEEMALKAIERINNGDVIMLDASSTVNAIIRHLKRFKGLTIITNSALTAGGLQELEAKVFVTGGYMPRNSQGFVGNFAESMVRNYNADLMFFTCGGLSMDGRCTDTVSEEMSIRRVMMNHSKRHILLCDSSKFGQEHCFNVCNMDDIDELISDAPFSGYGHEKQIL